MRNQKINTTSFDVFDTCLVRTCGATALFFDVLSRKVFHESVDEKIRQEFVLQRRMAEQNAMVENAFANINDIYNQFDWEHPSLKSRDQLKQLELELEDQVLVPVLSIKEKIDKLRKDNCHIIFISDMYLPSEFVQRVLSQRGLFETGDSLYVSCDIGLTKRSGQLYKYVKEKEGLTNKRWTHYGDNIVSDVHIPQSMGIKATLVNHHYSEYGKIWKKTSGVVNNCYQGILAGLSRAIHHSQPQSNRLDFIIDLIAPLYCSFLFKVFEDASKKGITRLYFCARDTYQLFQVAQIINKQYPHIQIHYFYTSQKTIHGNIEESIKLQYYQQIGLAAYDAKAAIIDTYSSGYSLYHINQILQKNHFNPISAYTLFISEMKAHGLDWLTQKEIKDLNTVLNFDYVGIESKYDNLKYFDLILENFFSTNDTQRTKGYRVDNGEVVPEFFASDDIGDTKQNNKVFWCKYHTTILSQYVKMFVSLGLEKYADAIIYQNALPTLCDFFAYPKQSYAKALLGCEGYSNTAKAFLPYVQKESLFSLLKNRGKNTWWPRATISISLPSFASRLFLDHLSNQDFYPSRNF